MFATIHTSKSIGNASLFLLVYYTDKEVDVLLSFSELKRMSIHLGPKIMCAKNLLVFD